MILSILFGLHLEFEMIKMSICHQSIEDMPFEFGIIIMSIKCQYMYIVCLFVPDTFNRFWYTIGI